MKIAWILPGGVDRSGDQRVIPVLLWLLERLARKQDVRVFATQQYPQYVQYPLLGAEVVNLGQVPGRLPGLRSLLQLQRLLGYCRSAGWRPEVLHLWWGGANSLLAGLAARIFRIPFLVHLMGGELVHLPEIGYGAQASWQGRRQVAFALKNAARVVVSSRWMADRARQHGVLAEILPLGVDPALFVVPQPVRTAPPWQLLHVASLNRVKDQTTLLHALTQILCAAPETRLQIVGEDTLQGEVQALAHRLGVAYAVSFEGFLPITAILPLYRRADLFVLPSRHDAAPVVMLEAAAAGLPTVGSAVGYAADWCPERAVAVPVGDAAALARAVLALLENGPRRAALGLAAQDWAQAHSADWTAAHYTALYHNLAGNPR